jgi:hypothetical protein
LTRRYSLNSPGRADRRRQLLWQVALLAVFVGLFLLISVLALRGAIVGQKVLLAGADDVIGEWCASVLG